MNKVISAEEAVARIPDGATVAWTALGLVGFAEEVAIALENRFLKTGLPRNLTAVHDSGCGDGKTHRGMNHLGHEGLVRRLISGHTGHAPKMGRLILEDKIEAYLLPQGVMVQLWRQTAGKKPGVITKVGLGTYVDPRQQGGKVSPRTKADLVKLIELEGEEWLLYKTIPLDVAVIRGTTADEKGNLTMEREALLLEALPMAQAAKNSGGIVIAQVENVAKAGTLHPKQVKVPGALVDFVVIAKPENHMQTGGTAYNPSLSGDVKIPLASLPPMPLTERKIIARRAAMELAPHILINLGIGAPDGVALVASEEGVLEELTLSTEAGVYGGLPSGGTDFGAAFNAEAIIEHHSQFDFYDGGGLDATFLGAAQIDRDGNVNVSKYGPRVTGPGGFINISQNSKKVVFCGTLCNGAETQIKDGRLIVVKEGDTKKYVEKVDQITFSGKYAQANQQSVLYVTERAVFIIEQGQLTLIEIAPGLDLERDVLAAMAFRPRVSPQLKEMPKEIFQPKWGGLRSIIEAKVAR